MPSTVGFHDAAAPDEASSAARRARVAPPIEENEPPAYTTEPAAANASTAPFGAGFQYPTFAARDLRLTESRQLGNEGQHWRARFRAFDSVPVEAVFFDHGQLASQFHVGDLLDTAFRLKRTRFDGYWRLEMELLDVAGH